jgi:hypothetical protein
MALLVPQIGEVESLRYLVGANNHIPNLESAAPRNLVLKLYSSNTTPVDGDVPSPTDYFEPLGAGNTNAYGYAAVTGYPNCVNNRTDQDYTDAYGILLNGSRWVINKTGTATTATYPEQTFTFTGSIPNDNNAGDIYGYFLSRANNMPVTIHGVEDAASVSVGSTITKGDNTNPVIGIVGNSYFTVDGAQDVDDITVGMVVTHLASIGNTPGIPANTKVVGVDRETFQVFIDTPLVANIQVATGPEVTFDFSKVTASNHGLVEGDVIYIAAGTDNTTTTADNYTIHTVIDTNNFTTTPALDGTGDATLYSSIFYAERFTNGPYEIQNPGDQIKVTLNVSLE